MATKLFNFKNPSSVFFLFLVIVFIAGFQNVNSVPILQDDVIQCGRRNSTLFPHSYIIGGHPALPGEFPWMVSMHVDMVFEFEHYCGGALIHPEWVLVAGHCLMWVAVNDIRIMVGSNDLELGKAIEAKEKYLHEKFDWDTAAYDVGLIRLVQPVVIDGYSVNTICLPPPNIDFSHKICTISGWGNVDSENILNPVENLQAVDIPIWPDDDCDKYLSSHINFSVKTMICAGYNEGGRDSCKGDSGSPLVCPTTDGVYQIAGIVSKGVGGRCGDPHYPGIYTRVTYFLDWIHNIMES